MKAIIIAAGLGSRMRPLTNEWPKCMLRLNGVSLLDSAVDSLKKVGVDDISVVRGYCQDKIQRPDFTYFENTDHTNNNILHSLMYAREKLEEAIRSGHDTIVSYSDIWYDDSVIVTLKKTEGDIVPVVDTAWETYYEGRTDHPIEEAENAILDEQGNLVKVGKHIFTDAVQKSHQGEFIGLWKLSPQGARIFIEHFDRINSKLAKTEPFQNAKEWQRAYITDLFQELIDNGVPLSAALIEANWKEFDTVQDWLRAGGEIPEGVELDEHKEYE